MARYAKRRFDNIPIVGVDGFVMAYNVGDARRNVDVVYEMIGGNERFADWADRNPGEFYTKMYAKNIRQERDHNHIITETLEDKLARLASEVVDITPLSVDGVPTAIGGNQRILPERREETRFAQVYRAQREEEATGADPLDRSDVEGDE